MGFFFLVLKKKNKNNSFTTRKKYWGFWMFFIKQKKIIFRVILVLDIQINYKKFVFIFFMKSRTTSIVYYNKSTIFNKNKTNLLWISKSQFEKTIVTCLSFARFEMRRGKRILVAQPKQKSLLRRADLGSAN